MSLPAPSFYEPVPNLDVEREADVTTTRPVDHDAEDLPFSKLDGRRFEILTYLLTSNARTAPGTVVTLVKTSGDQGRDVMIHISGVLETIIQCKNHKARVSKPALLHELVKLVLFNLQENYLPDGVVTYELWAPGGVSSPAEKFVTEWPNSITEDDVRQTFETVTQKYVSLSALNWNEQKDCVLLALRSRILLVRKTGVAISQSVRADSPVRERFFEALNVMSQAHVDSYLDKKFDEKLDLLLQKLTEKKEGTPVDDEINDARDYINQRRFADAIPLLKRLQEKKGSALTLHQTFRILSNLGAAAFGEGRYDDAAQYFLDALPYEKTDQLGRTNEVFAYYLKSDIEKAYSLASSLRVEYPISARLASLWVITTPFERALSDIEADLTPELMADAEVSLALARRALMRFDYDRAEELSRVAAAALPTWSQPELILAQISLGKATEAQIGLRPALVTGSVDLDEAIDRASQALKLGEDERNKYSQAEALVLRCELYLLQQKTSKARKDAEDAGRLDPQSVNVLMSVAQCQSIAGERDEALATLEKAKAIHARPDVILMYGRTLAARGTDQDLDSAISALSEVDLTTIPDMMRATVAMTTVQCMSRRKAWDRAEEYLKRVEGTFDVVMAYALRAYLANARDLADEAESLALEAAAKVSDTTHNDTLEFLARVFMQLGRPADALPLFENLFAKNVPSFDPTQLLDCAARLHHDGRVLEICEELSPRLRAEWKFVEFEVSYLEKYNIDKAIDRLRAFLAIEPTHKNAQLRLSIIGMVQRRPELVRSALADLPSVEELPVPYIRPAVGVLKSGSDAELAVDYAYRFLRLHFDELDAHQALIQSVLTIPPPSILPQLDSVIAGSAVSYQLQPQGDIRWAVLEDTKLPDRNFEEVKLDSDLAQRLLGKRVGDRVVLVEGQITNREALIRQIMPKHVRRFQDSMAEMPLRFGSRSTVEAVPIGDGDPLQGGLASFLASIQRRSTAVAEAHKSYATEIWSIHFYASLLGRNAYEGLWNLALSEDAVVKCCTGDQKEWNDAIVALRGADTLVLDLTAIATLRLLGLERILWSKPYQFVMSQHTWIEIQETLTDMKPADRSGGVVGYEDGRYTLYEESPESRKAREQDNQEFLNKLQANVRVVPAVEFAAVDSSARDTLEKFVGLHGAESMVIARDTKTLLWTDDSLQAQAAAQIFGSRRVWTQIVLVVLVERGLLAAEEYIKAVAQILGFRYLSTIFNSQVMLEAVRQAKFRPDTTPLKQAIEVFSSEQGVAQGLFRMFGEFLILLYVEAFSSAQRCLVVSAFLDSLWRNPNAHTFVLSLRQASARLFGLNVLGQSEFDACFDRWHRSVNNRLIS